LRRQVAAHAHAVVPASEEEIDVGIEQGFNRGIFARQFRQAVEDHFHLGSYRLPATDATVASHARLEAQGEHHLRHVDVMADRVFRRLVEGYVTVAAFDRQRVFRGVGLGQLGAQQNAKAECKGGQLHGRVIQVMRG